MTSRLFVQELKRARKETRERVEDVDMEGHAARGKMLMSTVDHATLAELYRLRDELPWG